MRRAIPLFLIAVTALSACNEVQENLDERTATLEARASVERYAAKVADTQPLQEAWIETLRELGQLTDPAALAAAVQGKVIPALAAYRKAISAMPVGTDPLREIHAGMIATHDALTDGYEAFAQGLTAETYEARRARLSTAIQTFHAAQLTYRGRLMAYYEELGLTLLPAAPVRL